MAPAAKADSKDPPTATAADILHLAGPLDDEAVAEILRLGASIEELEIATRYVRGEGDLVDRAGHPLSGRVAQLYEILSAAEANDEENRAPR
jgi:hypothetical protein